MLASANPLLDLREQTRRQLDGVVVGYEQPLDLLLVAAVAGGHVLLEGPPGIAKTLMAGAMARVLGVSFRRVQFTPDTTPEEISGRNIMRGGEAIFLPGAAFTNLLLADEINRTPARTQASLLEAMQERHVTVEGRTHWLPSPFMVIATQNPYEQVGIFPLPESQLDRFLFKIHLDYESAESEHAVLKLPHRGLAPDVLGDIVPLLDVARLQRGAGGPRRDGRSGRHARLHHRRRPSDESGAGRAPRREPARGDPPARGGEGARPAGEPADGHAARMSRTWRRSRCRTG